VPRIHSWGIAMTSIARRDFLKHSFAATAFATVAGEIACIEFADAAPIQVPTVDKLSLRILIDSSHDIFLKPMKVTGGRPRRHLP
jgi:7,8-dihydropterin-6-yl-methyl-4-(beta-D-ribofuranosyl)aminobenzene 5'-phosphate synthase